VPDLYLHRVAEQERIILLKGPVGPRLNLFVKPFGWIAYRLLAELSTAGFDGIFFTRRVLTP